MQANTVISVAIYLVKKLKNIEGNNDRSFIDKNR